MSTPILPRHVCPLCLGPDPELYFKEIKNPAREFFYCEKCGLVFVPPEYHVSFEDEKRRYDLHQNGPFDRGYRSYLTRLMIPLTARLESGARGLDFGSGPGPVFSSLLEEMGHPTALYDPVYAPDTTVLDHTYDFVTATEVIEHLRTPAETLDRMWALVRPGGWLGMLTQMLPPKAAFGRWSYKNDPTHILFFSPRVLNWLAERWEADLLLPQENVILMGKGL